MFAHARPVVVDEGSYASSQNGHSGHSNGRANGHSNGHANGHANGYANGHSSRKVVMKKPSIFEYPIIFFRCFAVVRHLSWDSMPVCSLTLPVVLDRMRCFWSIDVDRNQVVVDFIDCMVMT